MIKWLGILVLSLLCIEALSQQRNFVSADSVPDSLIIDRLIKTPYDKFVADLTGSERNTIKALEVAKASHDDSLIGFIYTRLSLVNYLKGNYGKSVEYNQMAIETFLEIGAHKAAGFAFCELGYQMKRRNLKDAITYMRKGIGLLKKTATEEELSSPFDNYGVLMEMDHQLDSALYYYNLSLKIKRENNDSIGIPFSLNNLAAVMMLKKDYRAAREYLEKAYEIRLRRKDSYGILESLNLYGDFYFQQEMFDKAIEKYSEGLKKSSNADYLFLSQNLAEKLSQTYEKIGDAQLALDYQRQHQRIKDSIVNINTNNRIAQLEVQFRTAEKERMLEEKEKEVARAELDASNKNKLLIIIGSLLIISLLVFLLVYERMRIKHRLKIQNVVLEEKEKGLKAVIEAEEEERNRIARELHDGIGQRLSGLKLGLQHYGNTYTCENEQAASALNKLRNILDYSSQEVRSLSHQMMPKALKEVGLEASISDMLESVFGASGLSYDFISHGINQRFEKNIEIAVFRVCQEIINNIIKHARATVVEVQLLYNQNKLILMVQDNGIGFNVEDKKSGIGLMNMRSRIEAVNGTFIIESMKEEGTQTTIRIPVKIASIKQLE